MGKAVASDWQICQEPRDSTHRSFTVYSSHLGTAVAWKEKNKTRVKLAELKELKTVNQVAAQGSTSTGSTNEVYEWYLEAMIWKIGTIF